MRFLSRRNCHVAAKICCLLPQQCLSEIRSPHYRDVDVVVIADVYCVCNAFSKQSWQITLILDDWAVCTANQKGLC